MGAARDRAGPGRARPGRIGVRAGQRAHRPARQPRRGRAARACRAPTSTASTRARRCRTPRPATAIPKPARRSSTSPTARSSACSSTTSPSTSATASCAATSGCSTSAPACCDAGSSGSRRPASTVRVSSVRLVSFAQRAVAAMLYEVEPLDAPARLVVQSELVANEPMPARSGDPRAARPSDVAAALRAVLRPRRAGRARAHRTQQSGLRLAAGMDHLVEGPPGTETADGEQRRPRARDDHRRRRAGPAAAHRQVPRLRLVEPSARRRRCAIRSPPRWPRRARTGWDGLLAEQRAYLDDFWERADVELEGDAELQQAVRFALFHTLQAGARGERRAIAAKGLTGPGYDGHAFWDTETFVLPVLTYTAPARRPRRAALAPRDAGPGARAGRAARARGRGVPVAHDRRARSARATGRRERPPSTSTPTSPTPSAATRPRPTTRPSSARPGSSCSSRRRGCGARSVTTTPTAAFASTASPARTSTAPSPTTTSTPT